ncbi:MAG: hypothetical protein IJW40_02565 [Clostridia bacterium]|nr:hypothetical protein [Clostridia bacterium]
MRQLAAAQWKKMDDWMQIHARPYDRAKWNYIFHGADKKTIVTEMLRYQNPDGGLGSGFEPDVLLPLSAAIPTAEAIFQAYDYKLDCRAPWFARILAYFENSVQNIPKYWEDCPREAMDYPHAPWWNYAPCTVFNPNPCAVVASAFLRYGTPSQQKLGEKIAKDCISLLKSNDFCGDHDTLNMLALVEQLVHIESPMVDEELMRAAQRRITENVCYDPTKWHEYTFCPLDFVSSPDSIWYDTVKEGIEDNINFFLDTINPNGVWEPNFSWGQDTEISRQVTRNWRGYITVKRAKILLAFGRIAPIQA